VALALDIELIAASPAPKAFHRQKEPIRIVGRPDWIPPMDGSKPPRAEPPAPGATPRPELIGRILSERYRVDALVATGAFGAVYRGVHLHMRKQVAIKVLHPEVENFRELVERFEREAVAGAHISHPNVAVASDLGKFDGESYFLVQEYVRGQTLRDVIDRGRLPAVRAAFIARQIAAALGAAHRHGIVHRDLKPPNVMLVEGSDDFVKLIDFGFARVPLDGLPHLPPEVGGAGWLASEAGVVFGSVAYMAPETALGMRNVNERSDLYALGVIFYELLTGKHPFDVTLPSGELFQQHREAPPPPLRVKNPEADVPPELEAVVLQLLEKEPERRLPSASRTMSAIDAAMRAVPGYSDRGRSDRFRAVRPKTEPPSAPNPEPATPALTAGSSATELDGAASRSVSTAKAAARKRRLALGVVLGTLAFGGVLLLIVRSVPRPSDPDNPSPEPSLATPAAPSVAAPASAATGAASGSFDQRYERKLRDQLLSFATQGSTEEGASVLLGLLQLNPRALEDEPTHAAAAALVSRLRAEDDSTAKVLYALSYRAGASGLDVLYRVYEKDPASRAGQRAESILSLQATSERASPALRTTWELRKMRCDQKPLLFERAGQQGDARTARVLSAFVSPSCNPRRGECCMGRDVRVERAIAQIEERAAR
jgi:eukaryotic-like serine/threonine-protein kinase